MLKISNETKVGILAVVALALGIWGIKFLKGVNILTPAKTFYVRYSDVQMLLTSSPVLLHGLQIGVVKSLDQDPEDGTKIIATLNVDRGFNIPKDARAVIVSSSLIGGKAVKLDFKTPCSNGDCAESGDFLEGKVQSFLESTIGDPAEMDVYTERLQRGLTAVYDSIADPNDPQGFGKTLVGLQTTLTNLAITTAKINRMLDETSGGLATTMNNAAKITGNISESNQNIKNALANLEVVTAQLKNADLSKTVGKAGGAMDSVTLALSSLKTTLKSASSALGTVDSLAQKMSSGGGSFSKILTDPELYDNLARDTRHLHLLMQDLRLNPKRYTTVKLKLFGKNKTKGYQNPLEDPAYRMLIDSLEREYSKKMKQ